MRNKLNTNSLGIVTVETNIYINYWKDMVLSLDSNISKEQQCTAHVFTDQVQIAEDTRKLLKRIKVEIHEIPAYGWPDATLRRYEIFAKYADKLNQKVLMHLDADMLFLRNVYDEIVDSVSRQEIALIAHPGYWRGRSALSERIQNSLKIASKPRGSWEEREISKAYVPEGSRKTYVCGGVWIGKQLPFLKMINELYADVELDRMNGVEAKWHDESHLNRWATQNNFNMLPPELCYVREYAHLKALNPGILAVTKIAKTR
jgi:hypothetical protein